VITAIPVVARDEHEGAGPVLDQARPGCLRVGESQPVGQTVLRPSIVGWPLGGRDPKAIIFKGEQLLGRNFANIGRFLITAVELESQYR